MARHRHHSAYDQFVKGKTILNGVLAVVILSFIVVIYVGLKGM